MPTCVQNRDQEAPKLDPKRSRKFKQLRSGFWVQLGPNLASKKWVFWPVGGSLGALCWSLLAIWPPTPILIDFSLIAFCYKGSSRGQRLRTPTAFDPVRGGVPSSCASGVSCTRFALFLKNFALVYAVHHFFLGFWKTLLPSTRFVTFFENFRLVYAVSTFSKPLARLFQNHASRLRGLTLFQKLVSRLHGFHIFSKTCLSSTRFPHFQTRLSSTRFPLFFENHCKNQQNIHIFNIRFARPSVSPLAVSAPR